MSGFVHLLTDKRIPGPCLVAAWSQGGLLETPSRWHATILYFQPINLLCFYTLHVFQSEQVFSLAMKSDDEMFHVAMYDWLIARNLTEKLLEVSID